MRFGDQIRMKRKEKKLTLAQLSEITGISRSYLTQLEGGTKQNPSPENIRLLAESLGIDRQSLELAVEAESSERLSTLREQINIVRGELAEFQEYMASTKSCIDKLTSIDFSSITANSPYSPDQEILIRKIRESLLKTNVSLEMLTNKQSTLGITMNLLLNSLDVPTWPEPIGNIIRDAEALGDDGLKFLAQQIKAIKDLLIEKKSDI